MNVLTEGQIDFYKEQRYLLLEQFICEAWLERLDRTVDELIERSRHLDESTHDILVEPGHYTRQGETRYSAVLV